jgi:hypothetical protein
MSAAGRSKGKRRGLDDPVQYAMYDPGRGAVETAKLVHALNLLIAHERKWLELCERSNSKVRAGAEKWDLVEQRAKIADYEKQLASISIHDLTPFGVAVPPGAAWGHA